MLPAGATRSELCFTSYKWSKTIAPITRSVTREGFSGDLDGFINAYLRAGSGMRMIKKSVLFLLSLVLMVLSFSPVQVQSRSDAVVTLTDSVTVSFPDYIGFNLDIETESLINDIRLHYIVECESYTAVTRKL